MSAPRCEASIKLNGITFQCVNEDPYHESSHMALYFPENASENGAFVYWDVLDTSEDLPDCVSIYLPVWVVDLPSPADTP